MKSITWGGVERLLFVSNARRMGFDPSRIRGFRVLPAEAEPRTFRQGELAFREYLIVK